MCLRYAEFPFRAQRREYDNLKRIRTAKHAIIKTLFEFSRSSRFFFSTYICGLNRRVSIFRFFNIILFYFHRRENKIVFRLRQLNWHRLNWTADQLPMAGIRFHCGQIVCWQIRNKCSSARKINHVNKFNFIIYVKQKLFVTYLSILYVKSVFTNHSRWSGTILQ